MLPLGSGLNRPFSLDALAAAYRELRLAVAPADLALNDIPSQRNLFCPTNGQESFPGECVVLEATMTLSRFRHGMA